jgi:23S rRNA (cytidine1920-2'-O)/16S rRNA (cytidine1409-2'-O)-methyltransferase
MNKRLDMVIHERGIVKSRSKAQDLIKRGFVSVNGAVIIKPSTPVSESDAISTEGAPSFVGRGGEKLEHALAYWNLDVSHMIAVDIGSSTGGFTDCLRRRGAGKVYAIDAGTDQIDARLRADARVITMEKTDVRDAVLPELADIAVVDLSFISLALVMEKISMLVKSGGAIILLVKPQFEVGKDEARKSRGIIRDESSQEKAIARVRESAVAAGLNVSDVIPSPISGGDGNREFLMLAKKA